MTAELEWRRGLPQSDDEWESLRAYFDLVGQKALEKSIADGVSPQVAGQRIAHFNDMLITKLKQKADERHT